MDKDLNNFKKWLKNLGLEVDGKIDDKMLKKLMPPQRLDMWRNIIRHVLPKEEVDLIKKAILLHKIEKLQKPLMAKVENEKDFDNVLKYEKLLTTYNKIQQKIINAKVIEQKMKNDLKEKIEKKNCIIKNIELKQNKSYISKHTIEYYNKLTEKINDTSKVCDYFSTETNRSLTKTDYEDSLIQCFAEIDEAKQAGTMKDDINIGQNLCNVIYSTIRDKSPAILFQTIEENLMNQVKKCNDFIIEVKETADHNNGNKMQLLAKFAKLQLKFKSNLSRLLTEKEICIKSLKEMKNKAENEITNLYKLTNVSCTDHELSSFKENLKAILQTEIINSIECPEIKFLENLYIDEETFKMLEDIFEKTNILNEKIEHKKIILCQMLMEIHKNKRNDSGLREVPNVMDNLCRDYLKKVNDNHAINKTINSLNGLCSRGIDNINESTIQSTPKSSTIYFRTLQDIKQYTDIVDVISGTKIEFEDLVNITNVVNNMCDISQKESMHKSEFNSIKTQIENNILEFTFSIEDCKLIVDMVINKRIQDLSSEM